MKNVLFATTALVFCAGVASAQDGGVALSGSAEMGLTYADIDDGTTDTETVEFHNDIDVTFTLAGQTNGLTFGASIDLDEADGDAVIEDSNSVFIEGRFGTLSMGDIDGAYDRALDGIAAGGLNDEADVASGQSGFDGVADGEIARYDYSIGGFQLSGSLELEEGDVNNIYGVGASYGGSFGNFDYDAGLGFQAYTTDGDDDDDNFAYGGSLVLGFGGFEAVGVVEIFDGDLDGEIFGGSLEYSTGPYGAAFGYERDNTGDEDADRFQGFVTYDLGGGAELIGAASFTDAGDTETVLAGFGIGLAF